MTEMWKDITTIRPETTRQWLGAAEGKEFIKFIKAQCELSITRMSTLRDPIEIGRAQGTYELCKKILTMREELSK